MRSIARKPVKKISASELPFPTVTKEIAPAPCLICKALRADEFNNARTLLICLAASIYRSEISPHPRGKREKSVYWQLLPENFILEVKSTREKIVSMHISKTEILPKTATAGSDVVQSGRPIFDDFFQHLWPSIGNNTENVVFQMVKRLWLIRIDQ
ncbi:hypothetical protein TNCV_3208011 [Trichonephila clavipes]|nr:hypothetical protein TNCV_3208011 [Trichonephila clavipes]